MKRFRNVLLVARLEDGSVPSYLFDRALSLARRNRAKLTLIDVVPDNDLASELLPPEFIGLDLRDRPESLARHARMAQKKGVDIETALAVGRPPLAITQMAHEKQIDLLVMGTVCRTGIRGFFIGNTADGMLRRVDCSLLTVKPDGFISPVTV